MIVRGISQRDVDIEVNIDELVEILIKENDTLEECIIDLEDNIYYHLEEKLGLYLKDIEWLDEDSIIDAVESKLREKFND